MASLCANVEHLFEPEHAFQQAHSSPRDGGTLVVLTPNVTWIVNRLLFFFGHWESSLLGGTRGHIRYLNQAMLARLLVENGFRDLDWSRSISLVLPPGNRAAVGGLPFRVPGFLVGRRVKWWPSLWAENFVVLARRTSSQRAPRGPNVSPPAPPGWSPDDNAGSLAEPRFRGNLPLLAYLLGVVSLVALAECSRMILASTYPAALALFPAVLAAVAVWAGMFAARNRGACSRTRAFLGRALEVTVALPTFLLLAPFLLLLGLSCWLATGSSHVGVVREGRSGQPFLRLALCTYPKGRRQPGRVGRWLERLRIAGLPALLNALRGRMGLCEVPRGQR